MKKIIGVLAALSATIAMPALADDTVTSPQGLFTNAGPTNQSHGAAYDTWYANNVRAGGAVGITNAFPRGTNGSIEFEGPTNAKADLEYYFKASEAFSLSTLNGLSYDFYRSSTSTASAKYMPALRLYVSDGSHSGYLVYEGIYNGQPKSPVDTWTHANVLPAYIWGTGTLPDASANYSRTAADWSTLLPGLKVYGFSTGIGSGWDGSFSGAVDNISYSTTATGPHTTHFDVAGAGAVPEPATWAMMLVGFGLVGFAMRRRRSGANAVTA